MKINVNGKEYEAYNLIMQRENALEIIRGQKKLESRNFSDFYIKMFLNVDEFNKIIGYVNADKPIPDPETVDLRIFKHPFRPEYPEEKRMAIHFTNRQHSWYLDVLLKEQMVESLTPKTIRTLGEEFGFHDFDYLIPELENQTDDDDAEPYFFFAIDRVLQTDLVG